MAVIEITMRHGELPGGFEGFVEGKAERIEKYLLEDSRIEFILDRDHESFTCEAIVHSQRKGGPQVVHGRHAEIHACVDGTIEKLRALLAKQKDRRKDHHRGVGLGEELGPIRDQRVGTGESGEEPSYEDIVNKEVRGD